MTSNKIIEKLTTSTGHSWIRYLKLEDYQKDKYILTKLRERKDHFMITIYKKDRQKLDIAIGDIIIFKLDNQELTRPIMKDFHISLPKNVLKDKTKGNKIKLAVLTIDKRKDCSKRPKNMIKNGKLDIRYFIPKKTIFGYPIYIIRRNTNHSSVWYSIGGGVRHINIKNFIDVDKIAELIGFYFGDGSTCRSIRSFRLTNSESSVLNYCLDTLEEMDIRRNSFKIQIIYSTNKELTKEIKNRCINFWSKMLKIEKDKIVSVNKAENMRETLEYGSARIFIDKTILVEIFLHGLLKGILRRITHPKSTIDKRLLKGFIRGLLAAEGNVNLNQYGSVVKVGIAYDPRSNELRLYKRLLRNLNINYGRTKGNELYIYGYDNMKRLFDLNAFKMHKRRNQRFTKGFLKHKSNL